jgi:26S proteasome regulatory subunit N8
LLVYTLIFVVPFEEDEQNEYVWFMDVAYLERMFDLSKKVSARERIIGWYHTGPKLHASDLQIHQLFRK